MSVCVYGNVCREYWKRRKVILSSQCPKGCKYFEEKYDINKENLKLKSDYIDRSKIANKKDEI